MLNVEQERLCLRSTWVYPPVFSGVRVARSLVFCVVFCRSLFALLSFFFRLFHCPSFFYLQLLFTLLVFNLLWNSVFFAVLHFWKFYIWDVISCSAIFTFIVIYICMCTIDDSSSLFFTVHQRLLCKIKATCAVERQHLKRKQNMFIMTTGNWWLEIYRCILRFKDNLLSMTIRRNIVLIITITWKVLMCVLKGNNIT